ncbi:MAG: hypothetical protein U1E76_18215 [Planctomycetota bacterium]
MVPITFVANVGQFDPTVRFVAQSGEARVVFRRGGFVVQRAMRVEGGVKAAAVAFRFESQLAAEPAGEGERGGPVTYLLGDRRERWRTDAGTYATLVYRGAWDGVDVRFHPTDRMLEYDLCLAPGTDADDLVVSTCGGERLELDADGSLLIHTALGAVAQPPPLTWREVDGARWPVPCRYRLIDGHRFGFVLPERHYDDAVIIDPGVGWSTFLGGVQPDVTTSVTVDAEGLVTVAGNTLSPNFPTTAGAYDRTLGGSFDAFVAQFDPRLSGSAQLRWSTFIGSSGYDQLTSVAVDASGAVVAAGYTDGTDFPTTPGAYQRAHQAVIDGLVLKLDPRQSGAAQLVWSTLLGGNSDDFAGLLHNSIDASGRVLVGGNTYSSDFPTTPGAYSTIHNGGLDAFLALFDPSKTGSAQLQLATLFGGSGDDYVSSGVVDGGRVFGTGTTNSTDLPTTGGAFDGSYNGGIQDGFLLVMTADGTTLSYCTYFGGADDDVANGVAVRRGMAAVTGTSASPDFPVTTGAFDTSFHGPAYDAFVLSIDPAGAGAADLRYASFLGGAGTDIGQAVVIDELNGVTVVGTTTSLDFPLSACTPGARPHRQQDVFLTRLRAGGLGPAELVTSTQLGGARSDTVDPGYSLTLDAFGVPVLAGYTESPDYPVSPSCFDSTKSGYQDVVVTQLPVAAAANYGAGWPGTGGIVPEFFAADYPLIGKPLVLDIRNSRGTNTQAVILAGAAPASLPTKMGGVVLVFPQVIVPIALPAAGAQVTANVPADLCGVSLYLQVLEIDPGASVGVSFSRGLCLTLGG